MTDKTTNLDLEVLKFLKHTVFCRIKGMKRVQYFPNNVKDIDLKLFIF